MSLTHSQQELLNILTHAPAGDVKELAQDILDVIGELSVLKNQTGLAMVPYTDSANGTVFHLGEVLVAEAHVRLKNGIEGYAMVIGRDTIFAMAVAVIDAAFANQTMRDKIEAFLNVQAPQQQQTDRELLRKVEATRVEMETF